MSQKNLHKLMDLRKIHMMPRNHRSRQQRICDAAAVAVDMAAGQIAQNDEKRLTRETAMYQHRIFRTKRYGARNSTTIWMHSRHWTITSRLRQQEEQARNRLEIEAEKARDANAALRARLQQYDKLKILSKQSSAKNKNANLLAELDDEDQLRPSLTHRGS